MESIFKDRRRLSLGYWAARIILILLVIATFLPFVVMLLMSVKESIDIQTDFWGLPKTIVWQNYTRAAADITRPILNSLFIALCTIAGELVLVSMSGYACGRHEFWGENIIFILCI